MSGLDRAVARPPGSAPPTTNTVAAALRAVSYPGAFDPVGDCGASVDGKPAADGTRSLLTACAIESPLSRPPDDAPSAETVQALG